MDRPTTAADPTSTIASPLTSRTGFFDDLDDRLDEAFLRRRRGAKWARYGPSVLPAWVADMDFPPAPPVADALAELLETGDLGYPWLGEPDQPNEVAVAFCGWAGRRYDWSIEPASVVVTVDVLQPLTAMIELCSRPGDGVVIQTPIYPPFLRALGLTGRTLIDNPLGPPSEGSRLDVEGLRAAVAAHPSPRVLLLCNPHNPTGRVFDEAELGALATLAVERDLLVISDEIHADIVYPGAHHRPFASLGPEVAARTVTLTSATKTFSIAGLRLAVAHFGSPDLLARYQTLPRFLLGGANAAGAVATLAAWRHGDAWVDELVRYLDANRQLLTDFVARELPGITHVSPQATYLAWLDCRQLTAGGRGPSAAGYFLERAGVALNDGADFGVHGEGFARLNFATSRPLLQRILGRLADSLH